MPIYSPEIDQLASLLSIFAIVALGGWKALYTAWFVRRTDPAFKRHITQRNRYRMVVLSALFNAPMIYLLVRFGVREVYQAVTAMIKADKYFGMALGILVVLALVFVPIACIGIWCIWKWPSPYAYRKGELYIRTDFKRRGVEVPEPWGGVDPYGAAGIDRRHL